MKKALHIYSFIIGLFVAFTMQGCSLQNEIEDLEPNPTLPTILITAPTSGDEIPINPIAHMVTVSGTTTGENLTSLSYTLDGTEVVVTSFDGSSPDFTFDLDFSHLTVGTNEDVSLKLTLKDAAGKEANETIAFKVKMEAYQNPTVTITSPADESNIIIATDGKLTITGTANSLGASTFTYNIGDGEQPLMVSNNAFSQEISFPNILPLETKSVTLTVTATDEAMQTGSKSISFTVAKLDPATAPGSTGQVSFTYAGASVTYTTVRAKDGNIWLQQNLGASQVATSATDAASTGDYFQWGRWADGHQKKSVDIVLANTISPNNPTLYKNPLSNDNPFVRRLTITGTPNTYINWWNDGATTDTWAAAKPEDITATNGCDPCKAIGSEWRLPTRDEWDEIIDKEGLTSLSSAFTSSLKIPTAGYRDIGAATEAISGTTNRIFLWSSSGHTTGTSALLLELRATGDARIYQWGKGYGSSVRCIKKN